MATSPSSFVTASIPRPITARDPIPPRAARRASALSLPQVTPFDSRIFWAKEIMRRELKTGIALTTVAREVGLSASGFIHRFKDLVGVPPGQWRKLIRVEKAARLLLDEPRLSVKEIAAEVGLPPGRLAREFRRHFEVTPLQYRRRAWGVELNWPDLE